jgi:hypothetical protein
MTESEVVALREKAAGQLGVVQRLRTAIFAQPDPSADDKLLDRLEAVDGKAAVFGSHNWSNEGVKTNRDASLLFFDPEVAGYLAKVFDYDWNRLATAKPAKPRVRVARPGDRTPSGFQRAAFSAVFED